MSKMVVTADAFLLLLDTYAHVAAYDAVDGDMIVVMTEIAAAWNTSGAEDMHWDCL